MSNVDTKNADEVRNNPDTGKDVLVRINGNEINIHRGSYTIQDLKTELGVEVHKELDQLVDGQLTPLADDGRITIKGGEEFVGHERRGKAS